MILANSVLTQKKLDEAKQYSVNIVLFNETDCIPQISHDVRLVNCTTQRIPSTWYTWYQNDKIFQHFKQKFPCFFQWGRYDLSLAFQKAIYWSNQKTGFLHYVLETEYANQPVYEVEPLHPFTPWKIVIKYTKQVVQTQHRSVISAPVPDFSDRKGIFIGNEFQLTLYKHILGHVVNSDDWVVLTDKTFLAEKLADIGFPQERIGLFQSRLPRRVPTINLLKLKGRDWFVLNQLLIHWEEVGALLSVAEQIAASNIKALLINEGENGIFGAVMGEVMHRNGIVTYNTMNGMKAGQAQDAFINFDYWFVWDATMKKLLTDKCHLPAEKLLVSGHLMEDEVSGYQYSGSIHLTESDIKNKIIISLFSVRGKREEKISAFQYLYQLAADHSDILVLVRPHPSETSDDFLLPPKNLNNVKWIKFDQQNSKQTLYDQLSVSKLSICFGSTVALESKWFGVPCISVEKRKESLIYAVDGVHIVKAEQLSNSLVNSLLQSTGNSMRKSTSVAAFIEHTMES